MERKALEIAYTQKLFHMLCVRNYRVHDVILFMCKTPVSYLFQQLHPAYWQVRDDISDARVYQSVTYNTTNCSPHTPHFYSRTIPLPLTSHLYLHRYPHPNHYPHQPILISRLAANDIDFRCDKLSEKYSFTFILFNTSTWSSRVRSVIIVDKVNRLVISPRK